jgi:GNAT superfamily N-acetyltransferase
MRIRTGTHYDRDSLIRVDSIAHLDPGRVELINRVTRGGGCLVAERGSRIIGYSALEYTFFEQGFVPIVFVASQDRRQGAARALLTALEAHCSTPKLFTSTNESNEPMRCLLLDLGYVESGIVHNLDPGDPELIYCRILEGPAA